MNKDNKTIFLKVGFTPTEYKKIAEKSETDLNLNSRSVGRKMARFVHGAALNKIPPRIDPIAQKQWIELSRLASNLNQLSHINNTNKKVNMENLNELIGEIRNQLIGIRGKK